jgi:hypothetical protein
MMTRARSLLALVTTGLLLVSGFAANATAAERPIPVLAYYYIWYNPESWNRAKTDYPLLGRYSSDDTRVLEQHVKWAQYAGIDGFIVSWKHTPALDARLRKLVAIADRLNFKLGIIYQGLDFYRRPLPTARVAGDLQFFARNFASDPAFDLYTHPLVIWSGTWQFTADQIRQAAGPVRDRLLVLASEKNVAGYNRLAGTVDGDAYYWSSVDPQTDSNYSRKLVEMASAVHHDQGLWIAPAAAGFDARLVGGHRVVSRRNGETLRTELTTAEQSSPDAVGLISWNEFSENSQVEPSRRFGKTYINVLRDALGGPSPGFSGFDSDNRTSSRHSYGIGVASAAGGALVALIAIVLVRAARGEKRRRPVRPGLEE